MTRRLVRELRATNVEVRLDTSAWGIWGRTVATCSCDGRAQRISAAHVLLATGARPRPVVFPGWQLSGVTSGTALSGRFIVAGSGPGLSARAVKLRSRGVDVLAVFEATSAAWPSEHAAYLRNAGVLLRNRRLLVRAEGEERVERAVVARVDAAWRVQPDSESTFDVDAILLDYGAVPCSELSRLTGCTHLRSGVDELVPNHDEWMQTDIPGILVAGAVCGVVGPAIAAEQGRLAGIAVARALGRLSLADAERPARAARQQLERPSVERDRNAAAYRVGRGILELARSDTVVCHCEHVTAADICAAVIGASPDPAPVRAETRAGMGICQARDCARQIEALVGQTVDVALQRVPPLSVRPPVVPIPLGAIAERPLELV